MSEGIERKNVDGSLIKSIVIHSKSKRPIPKARGIVISDLFTPMEEGHDGFGTTFYGYSPEEKALIEATTTGHQRPITTYHPTTEGVKDLISRIATMYEKEYGPYEKKELPIPETQPLYTISYKPLIKDDIAFMIEEENGAWGYYHNYYFITKTGQVYKYKANRCVELANKNKIEIDTVVKTLEVELITELNKDELESMLLKSKNIKLDSESYCTSVGLDAGEVCYYAFNTKISQLPILVGLRGDRNIHSKNIDEEEIVTWLGKVLRREVF